jgi:hypothetical protein
MRRSIYERYFKFNDIIKEMNKKNTSPDEIQKHIESLGNRIECQFPLLVPELTQEQRIE